MPLCWGSYESNLLQRVKEGKREREKEVQKERSSKKDRGRNREKGRDRKRKGREIHSVWPRVRGTVGV